MWDFPGKNTGVGHHFLLQEIFQMQGLNPDLLHYRRILYSLSQEGSALKMLFEMPMRYPRREAFSYASLEFRE